MRFLFRFKDGHTLLLTGTVGGQYDPELDRYSVVKDVNCSNPGETVGIVNMAELQYMTIAQEPEDDDEDSDT